MRHFLLPRTMAASSEIARADFPLRRRPTMLRSDSGPLANWCNGPCVTSNAGPHGEAQLYERWCSDTQSPI
jgi:hypothetical protein